MNDSKNTLGQPIQACLSAISPVDGRYAKSVDKLRYYFSEFALIRYRVKVEIAWLHHLAAQPDIPELEAFNSDEASFLNDIVDSFDMSAAMMVKEIESTTRHDVKAVEYYIAQKMSKSSTLSRAIPFVHFACTSEDINNVCYAMMLSDARSEIVIPQIEELLQFIEELAQPLAASALLSRTHGQAASPTTMGKELIVFSKRLHGQLLQFKQLGIRAKFNGAVGNYSAHIAAYPNVDWQQLCKRFINDLGLEFSSHTTQIEPHDQIASYGHSLVRMNQILLDFCRDIWTYISLGYFKQKLVSGEVGSSTMPHKINPIDFENAEGNIGVANALFEHLASKLQISRLQRDLSDSTAQRNLGSALANSVIAWASCKRGISKLEANSEHMYNDVEAHWEVLTEAVQTVLRKNGVEDAYEQLKSLSRGQAITQRDLHTFISSLAIPEDDKLRLLDLTPASYLGLAKQLANDSSVVS